MVRFNLIKGPVGTATVQPYFHNLLDRSMSITSHQRCLYAGWMVVDG